MLQFRPFGLITIFCILCRAYLFQPRLTCASARLAPTLPGQPVRPQACRSSLQCTDPFVFSSSFLQKGKAWRRGLCELHTFNTLRFRGQSHIGVQPASAACGVDGHCFSPQSPGENIVERLWQCVKSLFPQAPNGCLSGGFPNNPFQSLQRRLLLVKRSGRPNGPIQKQPKTHQFRNSGLHGRFWLLHTRFWLLHSWFWMFTGFVHCQFRPENGFSGRKRADNGRTRAENEPKNRPAKVQCPPPPKKNNEESGHPKASLLLGCPFL